MKKGTGTIVGEDFRRLQLLELDMLVELDRVCRKHGIKYIITCGTLLGGVRHKGFIPWDDDADVAMLREEYEKFKKISYELDPNICWFQDHDTDPEYIWGYGKLRCTGTTYIRPGQENAKFKTGVYVDVMPLDDIPLTAIGQIFNDFHCFIMRKILWSQIGKDNPSNNAIEQFTYRALSYIKPENVFKHLKKITKKSNNSSNNYVRVLLLPSGGKEISLYSSRRNKFAMRYGMPKRWLNELIEVEFEGYRLYTTKYYDEYLRSRYGDYMQLPPKEKQVGKAPAAIWEF